MTYGPPSGGEPGRYPLLGNEGSRVLNKSEPNLLAAIWRYRHLVVVVVATVVALGFLFQLVRPRETVFEAVATVVVQEPVSTSDLGVAQRTNIQFIAAQIEIMNSPVVAEEAAARLAEADLDVTSDAILDSIQIFGTADSPLVGITARHEEPDTAVAVANAVAEGYRQVSQRQATATSASQLARLDAQIEGIDERLAEISAERRELQEANPALAEIEAQARDAVQMIATRQAELVDASAEEAEGIRLQIQDLRDRISVYEQVISSPIGPELQALAEEEANQVQRRAQLLTLRDQIAVDAELAPDALALVQPATSALRLAGLSTSRVVVASLILGLALASALAYFLTMWRRSLTSRHEPEHVLGAPLLADVPGFEQESLDSAVPVRDHARSAAAEAFRFAASSLEAMARTRDVRSVFAVSSTLGHGKTTTIVNTAIASAISGASVVVVDCDFGNQAASQLLIGEINPRLPGVTDIVDGVSTVDAALHEVTLGNGASLSVIGRGTRPTLAATALQSGRARQLFEELTASFDLVLIDGPPLLQVAYASILAELADGLIVVVEHEGSYSELEDLGARLGLVGTPVLGYVYNRSLLRREMTMSEGSMMDILGDSGMTETPRRVGSSKRR